MVINNLFKVFKVLFNTNDKLSFTQKLIAYSLFYLSAILIIYLEYLITKNTISIFVFNSDIVIFYWFGVSLG
jgi:hypothetical protein